MKFVERNIAEDPSARAELIKMGVNAVPVIKVDNQTFVGFNRAKLSEALGL